MSLSRKLPSMDDEAVKKLLEIIDKEEEDG